ncbi:MAG: methyltransferase domain-containing protein [Dehalococcoidia bacterium]|nr:methyltransferase domain-containing protein [Dehalococcoidia bacterium]
MEQLYISGLARSIDDATLLKFIRGAVTVDSIEIIHDLQSGEPRGYAIARVADGVAEDAIRKLDGTPLEGNTIRVSRMPVTLPGEMAVRDWLHTHTTDVLKTIGVKAGQRVLDYGCGPGIFTVACARVVGESGKVYALDVRVRALERVRERVAESGLHNVETILQNPDSVAINLPAGSLDAVLIFDVMHDIKDKQRLLKEAYRVLKPNGFLSVFPMHWGDVPMMQLIHETGLFRLRRTYRPPNATSPSSVLSFVK